jgi:hypothetical protein
VPITLTAAQAAQLPPSGLVCKVEVWPDANAAGNVFVKQNSVTLATLPKPSGVAFPWSTPPCGGNVINPLAYSIDAATNGDGAFVTVWVE